MQEIEKLIEKILAHFAGPSFKDELQNAKKAFVDVSASFEEDPIAFDLRMSQFFDWYFFSRELSGFGQTPLEAALMVRDLRFSSQELHLIEVLKHHRHSLFEFIKLKGNDVHIKDLLRDEKIVVKASRFSYGFDIQEIFEVRLIPWEGSYFFTKGFCFHPANAKKFILSEVKKHRKDPDLDPEELMHRLIRMRYKCEQYRHLSPEFIYCEDPKLTI